MPLIPPLLPDEEYCKACQYPLRPAPGGCLYCWQQKQQDKDRVLAWTEAIGGVRAWEDFTSFNFTVQPYNEQGFKLARGFKPGSTNLFFYGPRGAGKSHCAAIAKRPLVTSGMRVKTVSMPLVMDDIRSGIKGGQFSGLAKQWLEVFVNTPVLSVEDMAVEKPSDFVSEFYYKFVEGRYSAKRNGLIITSNYSLDELETRWAGVDPQGRVVSRLKQMCQVASFKGSPDYRQQESR
jgi:DNA replication protein DnaC